MTDFFSTGECYETRVHDVTVTRTLGFQTPLKQLGLIYNRHCSPKGFNHRNWVNHYFNGGETQGRRFRLYYDMLLQFGVTGHQTERQEMLF